MNVRTTMEDRLRILWKTDCEYCGMSIEYECVYDRLWMCVVTPVQDRQCFLWNVDRV